MESTVEGGEALSALDRDAWLSALEDIGEERGYFEPLGPRHQAIFTDRGPVLLVTFETFESVRARPSSLPQGFALADARGWSQLCLLAEGRTFFRARPVYLFFDRLVDDGFFEEYDRVIFWGAGPDCGYAACAYSVAAPGAAVLAARPVATLSPDLAGWDRRFLPVRRTSFTDRYGFAPDMVEAAAQVLLFYDPAEREDGAHAGWFTRPNVTRIPMRGFGTRAGTDLDKMGVLPALLDLAAAGPVAAAQVFRLLRQRGTYTPWLRGLYERLAAERRAWRLAKVARAMSARFGGRRFRKAHRLAEARLEAEGRKLPPPLGRVSVPAE